MLGQPLLNGNLPLPVGSAEVRTILTFLLILCPRDGFQNVPTNLANLANIVLQAWSRNLKTSCDSYNFQGQTLGLA